MIRPAIAMRSTDRCLELIEVDVFRCGGLILQTELSRSATVADLRELLLFNDIHTCGPVIVGGRECYSADQIFDNDHDASNSRACVYMKISEPFLDKVSLRSALTAIDGEVEVEKTMSSLDMEMCSNGISQRS